MSKQVWIIQDWAGNHLFQDKTFDDFEDGWDFLYSKFESEEDLGEFYVEPITDNLRD